MGQLLDPHALMPMSGLQFRWGSASVTEDKMAYLMIPIRTSRFPTTSPGCVWRPWRRSMERPSLCHTITQMPVFWDRDNQEPGKYQPMIMGQSKFNLGGRGWLFDEGTFTMNTMNIVYPDEDGAEKRPWIQSKLKYYDFYFHCPEHPMPAT